MSIPNIETTHRESTSSGRRRSRGSLYVQIWILSAMGWIWLANTIAIGGWTVLTVYHTYKWAESTAQDRQVPNESWERVEETPQITESDTSKLLNVILLMMGPVLWIPLVLPTLLSLSVTAHFFAAAAGARAKR